MISIVSEVPTEIFLCCYCVRYGRHSDTKAGCKIEILACEKCSFLGKKKYMLSQDTKKKKRMPQMSCPSCNIWRGKEMLEAGD